MKRDNNDKILFEIFISNKLIEEGKKKYQNNNDFNKEALEYDNKFLELTNYKCLINNEENDFIYLPYYDLHYCSSCILKRKILELIDENNILINLKGFKLEVIIKNNLPIIKKRDNHYFIVIKSNIENFNIFYPLNEIFKSFYFLK